MQRGFEDLDFPFAPKRARKEMGVWSIMLGVLGGVRALLSIVDKSKEKKNLNIGWSDQVPHKSGNCKELWDPVMIQGNWFLF